MERGIHEIVIPICIARPEKTTRCAGRSEGDDALIHLRELKIGGLMFTVTKNIGKIGSRRQSCL